MRMLRPALLAAALGVRALAQQVDTLTFGDLAAEKAHAFAAERSDVIKGGLDEPARRILPLEPNDWQGGKLAFTMKVDPAKPNYFTIKLWGSDRSTNRLILFCEGRHARPNGTLVYLRE